MLKKEDNNWFIYYIMQLLKLEMCPKVKVSTILVALVRPNLFKIVLKRQETTELI
jgi:hypothetical protein